MRAVFDRPILALESSCDETSGAVVRGLQVLSNVVSSQADLHRKWGGVVPEAAARAHVEAILPVIEEALAGAGVRLQQMAAIAVTNRPGLVGALSVGVSASKALALRLGVPLIGIHHLEGHVLSPFADSREVPVPHLALVVSGGHTELIEVRAPGSYQLLGQTLDDAAGEAFDKGARLLGLGYPGGAAIQDAARGGDRERYRLPRGVSKDPLAFSFSGLKTAMSRLVESEGDRLNLADAAASLQWAIVEALSSKAVAAVEATRVKALTLVGGVAANKLLREELASRCALADVEFLASDPALCTDNAAMIGIAASFRLAQGEHDSMSLDCFPNAPLPGIP